MVSKVINIITIIGNSSIPLFNIHKSIERKPIPWCMLVQLIYIHVWRWKDCFIFIMILFFYYYSYHELVYVHSTLSSLYFSVPGASQCTIRTFKILIVVFQFRIPLIFQISMVYFVSITRQPIWVSLILSILYSHFFVC